MKATKILELASKLTTPTHPEVQELNKKVKEIIGKVNSEIKKKKLKALLIIGGSVGKGTWLPGISDIDFFLMFDLKRFAGESQELSNIAEPLLKKCFPELERLHGSRDYFSVKDGKYTYEIVPVLKIKKPEEARNITDCSPLHVQWIAKKISKNRKLACEIRLAKQFLKASGIYGAESYIRGLSGHVTEVLVIRYKTFLNFIKAAAKWKLKEIIDIEKHHNKKEVLKKINKSKLESAVIVIDPVEPYRNAAAAFGQEKFRRLQEACRRFLKSPSIDFFHEREFNLSSLKEKKDSKLIILSAKPDKGKEDVVGSKLLKQFEHIRKTLEKNEFKILESDWHWDEKGDALYWFYLDKKDLPETKKQIGPQASLPQKFIDSFKARWKRFQVRLEKGRWISEYPRMFRKPEHLVESIIKEDRLKIRILKL